MKITIALYIAAIFILFGGCSNTGEGGSPTPTQTKPPAIDVTTPDKALKSYWAVRDWMREVEFKRQAAMQSESGTQLMKNSLARVAGENILANWTSRATAIAVFNREIQEVKTETESRAVAFVVIRNSTPIPPGASPSKWATQSREQGDRLKYVLEKGSDGWRVSEIYEWDGIITRGWKLSFVASKPAPIFPSLTYEGL